MTPVAHAFVVLQRVHGGIVDWFHELMRRAGAHDVQVYARPVDDAQAGPHLVVLPQHVRPWPKMVESLDEIPVMTAMGDRRYTVPEPWVRLGQHLGDAVGAVFATADPRARRAGTPLGSLPAPLARWYEARKGGEGPHAWTVAGPDGLYARAPALTWRRPLPIEARYVVYASDHLLPPAAGEPARVMFGLPALAALFVGIHEERVLHLRFPPLDVGEDLRTFVAAAAEVVGGPVAEDLRAVLAWAEDEQSARVPLTPIPDVTADELASLARAFERPPTMMAVFAVQLTVGGGPVLSPGSTPVVHTTPTPR